MAVATDPEHALFIKQSGFGRDLALETLDVYLETKSVVVSTGARPINPLGL